MTLNYILRGSHQHLIQYCEGVGTGNRGNSGNGRKQPPLAAATRGISIIREESEDRERGDFVAEPSSIFNRFVQQHGGVNYLYCLSSLQAGLWQCRI